MGTITIRERIQAVCTTVVGFICNQCGREGDAADDNDCGNFHRFGTGGGYYSRYPGDMSEVSFVLCSECLKALVDGFEVPAEEVCHHGVEPYEAFHTEREEVVLVNAGWAHRPGESPWPKWDPEDSPREREMHRQQMADLEARYQALMEADLPWPHAGVYQHFKGGWYEVIDGEMFDVETGEGLVVYRSLSSERVPGAPRVFVRPVAMWADEIDRDGYQGPRFIPCTEQTFEIEGLRYRR